MPVPLPDRIAARLERLYPVADDPRLGWVPGDPAAAQAHLRGDGRCDLVLGYPAERFTDLDALIKRCLRDAAERGAPDRRGLWSGFVAAAGTALDAGLQLDARRERLQVYLRGHFTADAVSAALEAAGCPHRRQVVENTLALFDHPSADMLGLELGADPSAGCSGAVYVSLPNRTRAQSEAIDAAVSFLLAALMGDAAAQPWRAVAAELLETTAPGDRVYVSLDPAAEPTWVKIDVGTRPLATVRGLAGRLGLDVAPLLEAAAAAGLDPATQLGLRLSPRGPRLSSYHSLL